MSDCLTYPELWLLELSVKNDAEWLPLAWLPDSRNERRRGFSEHWNCPANGLSISSLAEVMWSLYCRHEIELKRVSKVDEDEGIPFEPASLSELHAHLLEERNLAIRDAPPWKHGCPFRDRCRVTAKGIARWEDCAKPDWTRYRGEFNGKRWECGEATWSQSAVLESFAREVLDVYSSDVIDPATIHWETAQVVHHEPWDVFPGKQLPHGITVSVSVTVHGRSEHPCDERVSQMLQEHYSRFRAICHWYENTTSNHPDRPKPQPDEAETEGGLL